VRSAARSPEKQQTYSMSGETKRQTTCRYRGARVPISVIRQFAREIAEQFRPNKIILFGSHAYGKPHSRSDVDILVVMPCRSERDQPFKIQLTVSCPFPLDLVVRKPTNLARLLKKGEYFHVEIVAKGRVLFEKGAARTSRRSRGRSPGRQR
jgi:predicted nucleotidyltransferase